MCSLNKEILEQYGDLQKEVCEVKAKIRELEKSIYNLEHGNMVADVVSGGMGGTQRFKIEGISFSEYDKKINLLHSRKKTLTNLEMRLDETINQIEKFISDIDDSRMRRIINFRFIQKMSWNKVANKIGGSSTADSIRMEFNRFIEK